MRSTPRNMVVDFSDIKRIVKGWIDRELDHKMILRHDDPLVAAPAGARRADLSRRQQSHRRADRPADLRRLARTGVTRGARHASGRRLPRGPLHGRLIAFDLDGTLIDSSRDLADSVNDLLVEPGRRRWRSDAIVAHGRRRREGARAPRAGGGGLADVPDALTRFLAIYDARLLESHAPLRRHRRRRARVARGCARLAVLTNKPLAPIEKILAGLGVRELFDDVIGSDGAFPRKPDPAGLLALMARAGAAPDRTLMVGDSRIDQQTAVNASARCCLVTYRFGRPLLDGVPNGDALVVPDVESLGRAIAAFVTGA